MQGTGSCARHGPWIDLSRIMVPWVIGRCGRRGGGGSICRVFEVGRNVSLCFWEGVERWLVTSWCVQTGNSRVSPQTLPATAAPGLRVNVRSSTMQRMCNGRRRHPRPVWALTPCSNTLETVFVAVGGCVETWQASSWPGLPCCPVISCGGGRPSRLVPSKLIGMQAQRHRPEADCGQAWPNTAAVSVRLSAITAANRCR